MRGNPVTHAAILTVTLLLAAIPAWAGGRSRAEVAEAPCVYNAWHRDTLIYVALFNPGDAPLSLDVAVGTHDTARRIFLRSRVELGAHTFQVVNFPVAGRTTPRGDRQRADRVFVGRPGETPAMGVIQNAYPPRNAVFLRDLLVPSGGPVRYDYWPEKRAGTTLLFLPRVLGEGTGDERNGDTATCSPPPISSRALAGLALPAAYRDEILARAKDHFVFRIDHGAGIPVSVTYPAPNVSQCANLTIHAYRYRLHEDGTLRAGGEAGAVITVYNPATIQHALSSPSPGAIGKKPLPTKSKGKS